MTTPTKDIQPAIEIARAMQDRLGHFTERNLAYALIETGLNKYDAHHLADLTVQILSAAGSIDWQSTSYFGREYTFTA